MGKVIPHLQLLLILILISLLLFALDTLKALSWPKKGAYFLTNPITFGLYKVKQTVSRQLYFIVAARSAAKKNAAMQEQLGQLLSENAQLRTKLSEAETLLEQTGHLDPKVYQLIPARPIGLDRFLKIDKGRADGIIDGQAAVFKQNYIGQVTDLSEKGASIKLLTDPDSKLAAFSISKEGRAKGVVLGQFGSEMLFDKILHEEKIEVGDLVYSEGTEGFLPRGLIVGRVTKVMERDNEVFKQAKVEPLFDFRDLELIFVIEE